MPDDAAIAVALRMYKQTRMLVDYTKLNAEHDPLGNWRELGKAKKIQPQEQSASFDEFNSLLPSKPVQLVRHLHTSLRL